MRYLDMGPYGVCHVAMVHGGADWARLMKNHRIQVPFPLDIAHTSFINIEPPLIVVSFYNIRACGRHEAIGYCVHEAVHVWQYICEYIKAGTRVSREIEAYSVQWISGWLIKELKL